MPGEPPQRLPHLGVRVDAERARAHAVHDHVDAVRVDELDELAVAAEQPREPHGVGQPDGDHPVGRGQARERRRVAAGRELVARELLVALEAESGVDDDVFDLPGDRLDRRGHAIVRELGPAARADESGEHVERGARRGVSLHDALEFGTIERVAARQAAGGGEPGRLVEQAERRRDGPP